MNLRKIKYPLTALMLLALNLTSVNVLATPIEILNDGSFESTISPQGSQTSWNSSAYGSWAVGDPMSTVSGESGITPLAGSKMLRFGTSGGSSSDLYQIVDISGYATQIDAGLASVDMSISYNAAAANSGMGLRLLGWSSAPTGFGGNSILGGDFNNLTADGNTSTWQEFSVDNIVLTAGIRYLAFGIHDRTALPLAYADNASLKLNITSVPEPSILALMSLGLFGIGMLRKKV